MARRRRRQTPLFEVIKQAQQAQHAQYAPAQQRATTKDGSRNDAHTSSPLNTPRTPREPLYRTLGRRVGSGVGGLYTRAAQTARGMMPAGGNGSSAVHDPTADVPKHMFLSGRSIVEEYRRPPQAVKTVDAVDAVETVETVETAEDFNPEADETAINTPSEARAEPATSTEIALHPAAPVQPQETVVPGPTGSRLWSAGGWQLPAAAGALAVVILLAFLIGRLTAPAPLAEADPAVEPQVLRIDPDVERHNAMLAQQNAAAVAQQSQAPRVLAAPVAQQPVARISGQANLPRTVGLNYVIMQSFPDLEGATRLAEALQARGIEVTVEQGLTGWVSNPAWYTVVGTAGFERLSGNVAYQRYRDRLEAVATELERAGMPRIQPSGFSWRRTQ